MNEELALEKAYRRGYDQGLYFALKAAGASDSQIQELAYKVRIENWRYGRKQYSLKRRQNAPQATEEELKEIKTMMFLSNVLNLNGKADA